MLRAAGVSFTYGRARKTRDAAASGTWGPASAGPATDDAVLNDVFLNVERGELVGILGPNGSGKTTLLKLLGGLYRPTTGSVTLDNRPVTAWSQREIARRIAFVPQ